MRVGRGGERGGDGVDAVDVQSSGVPISHEERPTTVAKGEEGVKFTVCVV